MDTEFLKNVLEGALCFSSESISPRRICQVLEITQLQLSTLISQIEQDFKERGKPYQIRRVSGGFKLYARPEYSPWIQKIVFPRRRIKFSRSALETLAIIAYRQPIIRAEIERIRGVETRQVLQTLLQRRLIKVVGRKKTFGRPLLYGTTDEFLKQFGLNEIDDLPSLEEFVGQQ